MSLREAERRHKQRQQSDPIHDREIELNRALDDQRVMTFPQWCEINGFSICRIIDEVQTEIVERELEEELAELNAA